MYITQIMHTSNMCHSCVCVCVCVCVYVHACVRASNMNILYSVLVCMCVHALRITLYYSCHIYTHATALHAYWFLSFAAFNVGGKPLWSFRAVPQAKMSSSRSWSSFSLVKKLSKNTWWFFPLRMRVRSFTTLCPSCFSLLPSFPV